MQKAYSFKDIVVEHANLFVVDCIQNGFTIDNRVCSNKPNIYKIGLTKDIGNITVTIINRDHEIQVKRHYDIKSAGNKTQKSFIYKKSDNGTYTLKCL